MAQSKAPKSSSHSLSEATSADPTTPSSTSSSPTPSSRKRKRRIPTVPEIEVDITAPEPPSKAALRRLKKGKAPTAPVRSPSPHDSDCRPSPTTAAAAPVRSKHGIWIGNLPWSATTVSLREFLLAHSEIQDADVTRVHLPAPSQAELAAVAHRPNKPANKGFAYVDFGSKEAQEMAIRVSERLMGGRKVLVKDASSFEGRPEKKAAEVGADGSGGKGAEGKTPGKRIFVGNLGFDCEEGELREHWEQCGHVASVFVATFEDSGKCKGYGWVTFAEVEGAVEAVRGWVEKEGRKTDEESSESEDEGTKENEVEGTRSDDEDAAPRRKKQKKQAKPRKWFVNRFKGRLLRVEFAEDPTTRYKKRYGKAPPRESDGIGASGDATAPFSREGGAKFSKESGSNSTKGGGAKFKEHTESNWAGSKSQTDRNAGTKFKKRNVDARTIKPGAALAGAPRLTGAIVEAKGRKTTFD